MQDFRKIVVWQRSHELTLAIYRATGEFPPDERFGLTSQMRRAASSVPTNIAEGAKRRSARDYSRFLNIAEGSIAETEYLLILSADLHYLEPSRARALIDEAAEIAKMLHSLRTSVEASQS